MGGARPPPLITFTLTSKVAVYAPAEWADTLILFHLYQYIYSVFHPTPLPCVNKYTRTVFKREGGSMGSKDISPVLGGEGATDR